MDKTRAKTRKVAYTAVVPANHHKYSNRFFNGSPLKPWVRADSGDFFPHIWNNGYAKLG